MGADDVLFLEDPAFLEGDGYATALTLSKAVAGRGPISCSAAGRPSTTTGAKWSHGRGISRAAPVGAVLKLDIGDGPAVAERAVEGGREVVEVTLPAVITAAKASTSRGSPRSWA